MNQFQKTSTISEDEVRKMKLKGKPKCTLCGIPLTFVYEGSRGYTNQKCERCRNSFLLNSETLEVLLIQKAM